MSTHPHEPIDAAQEDAELASAVSAQEQREKHRRHVAVWCAAGGTFVAVVALWATLLPTQLGDVTSFGFAHAPAWQPLQAQVASQLPEFEKTVNDASARLDALETSQLQAAQRASADEQAAQLRARIEAVAAASDSNVNAPAPAPAPAPKKK